MENREDLPTIEKKVINGVEITNLDLAKIAMVCDYLILDRFHDISSFLRLEKCFGPFFNKENIDFLPEVFKEICGEKKKYISFGRLILAYTKWKSKSSTNEKFNKFMDLVFGNMIKTQDQVIGKLIEGGRIFSTRNTKGRKVISRFSVLTDESKNKIEGLHIQYDDVFDTVLSPIKKRDNITLEINFAPNGQNIRDRDGISHIAGKYNGTRGIIKFLIFKCRSGKTFYIGDPSEEEGEQFEFFLFGTSSCQLKSVRVELINDQLIYFEPKFQPSLRVNQKIVDFDSIDEKYINDNIINSPLIFEENEMQNMPMEQLIEANTLLIPCISDDAFIDKKSLIEPLSGKDFNEIYKTYLVSQNELIDKEKEELKKKIYEKTIMRKHLIKIYFNKFKVQENISVLKDNKPPDERVDMDKFLCKVKAYRKKMDKKIEKKKEEIEAKEEDENYWDDGEDWAEDEIKSQESNELENKVEEKPKEEEIRMNILSEIEKNENKEENIIEIEGNKIGENKIEIERPEIEKEIKIEDNVKGPKIDDLQVNIPGEERVIIEVTNEKEQKNEEEKIIFKGNKPKKLLNKSKKKIEKEEPKIEEIKIEEIKIEEPKIEEAKLEDPKREEIKLEEPRLEEMKVEEPKIEEIKVEEPKIELKLEESKKEEIKLEEPKIEEIKLEEPKKEEIKKEIIKEDKQNINEKKEEDKKKENNRNIIIKEKKNENKNNIEQNNNINNIGKLENNNNAQPKKTEPPKKRRWFCNCF